MQEISFDKAVSMAKAEIDKVGEKYVYSNFDEFGTRDCLYVDSDGPSCLVGRILIGNGLVEADWFDADRNEETFEKILCDLEADWVWIEPKAVKFLSALQGNQDGGIPWGEALKNAIGYAEAWQQKESKRR